MTKIIEWVKMKAKNCEETPKSYRQMVLILNQALPEEEATEILSDWIEEIGTKMKSVEFAMHPFSAAGIQIMSTIGQVRPSILTLFDLTLIDLTLLVLLKPYSAILSEFVLSFYLQSEAGIPKVLGSSSSVPENVNLTLFLKCLALKAITKSVILLPASTPFSRNASQPHLDEIQTIGEQVLDLIQSQE